MTYDLGMNKNSPVKFQGCEYVFKFKKKLSSRRKHNVIAAIVKSPLFYRKYKQDGNTWYELRSAKNHNLQKAPDATLLLSTDFVYVMRKSKAVPKWQNLDGLKDTIEGDLDFFMVGDFFSYS